MQYLKEPNSIFESLLREYHPTTVFTDELMNVSSVISILDKPKT